MKESPEGLKYGHDNDKYAKADKPDRELEKGKIEQASWSPSPEHEKAETERMLHKGSHDPMYESSKKNK
jgi:hypothetical protein